MSDVMAEEVNGVATKQAFGDVDDQAVLLESLEQQVKVFFVCLNILASHQDVINLDEGEIQTVTVSIRRWKAWAAFFEPKGTLRTHTAQKE